MRGILLLLGLRMLAADRGAFIDQSQSLNIFMANPTFKMMTSMHFYGWKKGLKTGMYYLRSKGATDAIQFTIDPSLNNVQKNLSLPVLKKNTPSKSTPTKDKIESSESKEDVTQKLSELLDFSSGPVCTMQDGCISCGS
eukprot:TRINITY_DN856_c0_g2_i2.p1 TRINITY_DN856_c0_g2~~TRINITY_DN856_c0_g2_i2.p1  ORF type:complete len:139 (-),score=41.61 TRINITY_DN856_c0_g2_i2:23-439(-)